MNNIDKQFLENIRIGTLNVDGLLSNVLHVERFLLEKNIEH